MDTKIDIESKKPPKLIYGTAWKKEHTALFVEMALGCGFRAIDTASQPKHYEEFLVGEGLKKGYEKYNIDRENIFIQTKFTPLNGQDPNKIPYNPNAPVEIQIGESLEISLKNLQTSYLDSLLLHSPIFPYSDLLKAWRTLERFYSDKKVRSIGISNCYDVRLLIKIYEDAKIKPSFIQNRFYSDTLYDKEVRAFCLDKKITYQGFWTLTANPHILNNKILLELSKKYRKTSEEIWYRFLTKLGIIPLIGSTSKEHLTKDILIFKFELEDCEIEEISRLL